MKQAEPASCGIGEMERRYKLMSWVGVRNLSGYNHKIADVAKSGTLLEDPATIETDNPNPAGRSCRSSWCSSTSSPT